MNDGFVYTFGNAILCHNKPDQFYIEELRPCNLMKFIFYLEKGGIKVNTKKREVTMYQFGGKTCPARYPLFVNNGSKPGVSLLTRPVTKSRPGEIGHAWLT